MQNEGQDDQKEDAEIPLLELALSSPKSGLLGDESAKGLRALPKSPLSASAAPESPHKLVTVGSIE
jgi:hypothetical protein